MERPYWSILEYIFFIKQNNRITFFRSHLRYQSVFVDVASFELVLVYPYL